MFNRRKSIVARRGQISGTLLKRGRSNNSWKQRYFVLDRGVLYYYKNDKAKDLEDATPILSYTVTRSDELKKFAIVLTHAADQARPYYLAAGSEDECCLWIAALTAAADAAAELETEADQKGVNGAALADAGAEDEDVLTDVDWRPFEEDTSVSQFKISMIGMEWNGKTALLDRYCFDEFEDVDNSTLIDTKTKEGVLDGRPFKLTCEEVSVAAAYQKEREEVYREVEGFVAVFSVRTDGSFKELTEQIKLVENIRDECPMVMVATMLDSPSTKRDDRMTARLFAESRGWPYFETSAAEPKKSDAISDVFEWLMRMILEKRGERWGKSLDSRLVSTVKLEVEESDYIKFDTAHPSGMPNIKAATLPLLFRHLISKDYVNPELIEAFLATYPRFITPKEILRNLVTRHTTDQNDPTIHVRVTSFTQKWVERCSRDIARDKETRERLKSFVESSLISGPLQVVNTRQCHQIIDAINAMEEEEGDLFDDGAVAEDVEVSTIDCPNFNVAEAAVGLTHHDCGLIHNLDPLYLHTEREKRAMGLLVDRSIQVTRWVGTEVCRSFTRELRLKVVHWMIELAAALVKMGNFFSAYAVLSGLVAAPVARLSETWQKVDSAHLAMLEALKQTFSPDNDYAAVRQAIKEKQDVFCIPMYRLVLADIALIEDTHTDFVGENELINVSKLVALTGILRALLKTRERAQLTPWYKRDQNKKKLQAILDTTDGLAAAMPNFVSPRTVLLHKGLLWKHAKGQSPQSRTFYLFSTFLMWTKPAGRGREELCKYASVNDIVVQDYHNKDIPHAFKMIHASKKEYTLAASSDFTRDVWLNKLRKSLGVKRFDPISHEATVYMTWLPMLSEEDCATLSLRCEPELPADVEKIVRNDETKATGDLTNEEMPDDFADRLALVQELAEIDYVAEQEDAQAARAEAERLAEEKQALGEVEAAADKAAQEEDGAKEKEQAVVEEGARAVPENNVSAETPAEENASAVPVGAAAGVAGESQSPAASPAEKEAGESAAEVAGESQDPAPEVGESAVEVGESQSPTTEVGGSPNAPAPASTPPGDAPNDDDDAR